MKYGGLGVVVLLALFVVASYSSGVAKAGDEVRLRAPLMAVMVDPPAPGQVIQRSHADFRQRADRTRFSVEVENIPNIAEPGIGTVVVTRNAGTPSQAPVLQAQIAIVGDPLQGTAFGRLSMDSRLGDSVPVMIIGDTVNVFDSPDASGNLILEGTLEDFDWILR